MIIKTTEELANFTCKKVKISGLTHMEIAEKINKNRQKSGNRKNINPDSISHAIQFSKKSESGRNGIRREILLVLGFKVINVFFIKRQKKS